MCPQPSEATHDFGDTLENEAKIHVDFSGDDQAPLLDASERDLSQTELNQEVSKDMLADCSRKSLQRRSRLGIEEKQKTPSNFAYGSLETFVHSQLFVNTVSVLVMLNIFCLGALTDYHARYVVLETPPVFRGLDLFFCIFFATEICLRIYVTRCEFFCAPGRLANLFDLSLVATQVYETIFGLVHANSTQSDSASSTFRILRIFRMFRVVRIARVLHLLDELRILIGSIARSLSGLCWTMLLVFLITSAFGVILTEASTQYRVSVRGRGQEPNEEIVQYYGTWATTMTYLYMAITDGIHWGELLEPLSMHVSSSWTFGFILYTSILNFVMMNVISSCFVESFLHSAEEDRRLKMTNALWEQFSKENGITEGCITKVEFERSYDTELMIEYLASLGMSPEEAREANLFELIDIDGSGYVESEELVAGCVRLSGPARAVDVLAHVAKFDQHRECTSKYLDEIMVHAAKSKPPVCEATQPAERACAR